MNRNYAKPRADMTPEFASDVLEINRRKVYNPKAVHCKIAGYLPLSPDRPVDPPEGKHYELTDKIEANGDEGWRWKYVLVPDPPPSLAYYDAVMEDHLLAEREARGYTTREPDAYLTSSVPRWRQDAMDWVAHRDAVMGYALALINAVQAGEREPPTMAEFRAGLPRIEWTYTEGA